ncbi:MAG: B12-binding domain-containing radical SAM protein, partial [Candidatus Hodarchaeales archaeon]
MKFYDNPITKIRLVSIGFPGRDLCLAPVSIKSYLLRDPNVSKKFTIDISQFDISTPNEKIFQELNLSNEEIYGFTSYVWNFDKILGLAENLKEANPRCVIVLGGPEASGLAQQILTKHDFVDFVINGEGEFAFKSFLTNRKYSSVPGLVYRNNGTILSNPESQMKNLDDLALPYESQDYQDYLEQSETPVRAAIETSRGCPFSCVYCTWGERRMTYFSLEKLKPAFEFLFNHPKVRTVYITDSNPFLKKERSLKLLNFLIEANTYKKPVTFEVSPEY